MTCLQVPRGKGKMLSLRPKSRSQFHPKKVWLPAKNIFSSPAGILALLSIILRGFVLRGVSVCISKDDPTVSSSSPPITVGFFLHTSQVSILVGFSTSYGQRFSQKFELSSIFLSIFGSFQIFLIFPRLQVLPWLLSPFHFFLCPIVLDVH